MKSKFIVQSLDKRVMFLRIEAIYEWLFSKVSIVYCNTFYIVTRHVSTAMTNYTSFSIVDPILLSMIDRAQHELNRKASKLDCNEFVLLSDSHLFDKLDHALSYDSCVSSENNLPIVSTLRN